MLGPAASVDHALDLVSEERPLAAVLDFNLVGEKVTPVALQLKALSVPFVLAGAAHATELAARACRCRQYWKADGPETACRGVEGFSDLTAFTGRTGGRLFKHRATMQLTPLTQRRLLRSRPR